MTPLPIPPRAPMTATDISAEWLAVRREIIGREGLAVRAGWPALTIEVKSQTTNEWHPLSLKENTATLITVFDTAADRDAVLAKLTGKIPL